MQFPVRAIAAGMIAAATLSSTYAGRAAQARPANHLANQHVESVTRTTGWSTVQKIVETFKGESPFDQGDKAGRAAMAQLIDFDQIARRALNAHEWQSLSSSEKQELASTIQTLLERRYYPRWKKIFGKGEVIYASEIKGDAKNKGDIFVATTLRLGKKDDPLTWQLSTDAGKTRVVSLAVSKKDLLTTLHQRIEARQVKGGYPAMIAWLKGRGKFAPKSESEAGNAAAVNADATTSGASSSRTQDKQAELTASKNAPKSGSLID